VSPNYRKIEPENFVLTGFRNRDILEILEEFSGVHGSGLAVDKEIQGPPRISLRLSTQSDRDELIGRLNVISNKGARIIPRAADSLASIVPALSAFRSNFPKTSAIAARSTEHWRPDIARFESTNDAIGVGGFRLATAGRKYIYRNSDDIGRMSATIVDARWVKYFASHDTQSSLIGYNAERRVLYVPLGADLPGLFSRIAVLCSGRPPVEDLAQQLLEYSDVPAEIAAHLNHLLMN